jgi:hypothetical protein
MNKIDYPLSDDDIRKFFKNQINIMRYSELQNYDNIFDVLGKYERCILLFEAEKMNHWVLLMIIRKPNKKPYILFHDSYGIVPNNEFNYIPKSFQKMTKQDRNVLLHLLIDCPLETHYNQYRLQKISKDIATCGKHCCVRGLFNKIDEDEFNRLIRDECKLTKLSTDEIINALFIEYYNL